MSGSTPGTGVQLLSIVVPVYQCASCVVELHTRLKSTLESLDIDHEIVLVDDRSPDDSWPTLKRLAESDRRTIAIRMSRNFGQQLAINAGLANCRGDFAVVMDCDLQDPPEMVPRLLEEARRGFDIVYGRRRASYDSWWRMAANRLYFKALNWLSGQGHDGDFGSFSLISRKVIDNFRTMREPDQHYIMMLRWMGYAWAIVDYEREARPSGRSSYTISRLLSHAFSGLVFSTTKVLKLVICFGFFMAALGLATAIAIIVYHFMGGIGVPGWASLAVSQLSVGGLIIICIGITALYVGKILETARQRPLFIVDERLGADEALTNSDQDGEQIDRDLPIQYPRQDIR